MKSTQADFSDIKRILVLDEEALNKMIGNLKLEDEYSCDTEFKILDERNKSVNLAGISFTLPRARRAYYIPVRALYGPYGKPVKSLLSLNIVRKKLKPILESHKQKCVWAFFKADYQTLHQHGIDVWNHKADVYLGSLLLNENLRHHDLKELASRHLKYQQVSYAGLLAINKIRKTKRLRKLFRIDKKSKLFDAWVSINSRVHKAEEDYKSGVARWKKKQNVLKELERERSGSVAKEKRPQRPDIIAEWDRMTKGRNNPFITEADIAEVDLDLTLDYATDDTNVTIAMWELEKPVLKAQNQYEQLTKFQTPFAKVLARMELRGTPVDRRRAKIAMKKSRDRVVRLEYEISNLIMEQVGKIYENKKKHEKTGRVINLNSPPQLAKLLYRDLGLPIRKRTKTKAPACDEEALSHHAEHKIVKKLLRYRKETKILETYLTTIVERSVRDKHGVWRIHPTFNQYGAATGRLSCKEPNLQNLPRGPRIRKLFIAPKGWTNLVADYSQIELRFLAKYSKDRNLRSAYMRPGGDIHSLTASKIFPNLTYDESREHAGIPGEFRQPAKTVNFAVIYGQGPDSLAVIIRVPVKQAQKFIKDYFKAYPMVQVYIGHQKAFLIKHAHVETLLGRRRRFPEIRYRSVADNVGKRNRIIRQAINARIQGSAGDLAMLAMIQTEYGFYDDPDFEMQIQVHDELKCMARLFKAFAYGRRLVDYMTKIKIAKFQDDNPLYPVPLIAEMSRGKNWAAAKG